MQIVLTSELLLAAYTQGLFPMAERVDSPYVRWICPELRGQLPIENLYISRSLKKTVLRGEYYIRINTDFYQVIDSCAKRKPARPESWINAPIRDAFCKLHDEGYAHSVECWRQDSLVGGLYGLAQGGAFFGESMFSEETDASKICLVHLAARLWHAGFTLLDTQFINPHLQQFGVYEIPYKDYMLKLGDALKKSCDFVEYSGSEASLVQDYFEKRNA